MIGIQGDRKDEKAYQCVEFLQDSVLSSLDGVSQPNKPDLTSGNVASA